MRTSSLFLSGLLTAAAVFSLSSTGAQAIETGGAVWRIPNAIHSTTKAQRSMESPISKEVVDYSSKYSKGTIVVNTAERRLYYVLGDGKAIKYGIGVGRPGFTWSGTHTVTRKAEWPGWTPPPRMRTRQPDLPYHMAGGPDNPLGARAMYIGSTIYRIHGTAEPWTIGQAVSSGCIRMANNDVVDLYERVNVGTRVVVEH
ncbi:putative L,D-transpeptidase ErfK/SrfK precursor [Hartmannibacter diazotrophicus]|uniref:Putative L,D-transpeptidase ErfK/SrfK n=1 Tax=Hartmannibacter diazotrophicus TaxID=1482074 RepID=A0A2C9D7B6_9HYPH|nr:L,D-transpeptidase [Hartmannibacter diazotrophicus]SON55425.1 putative L,D-transpeptidase ErfK/SrfK precursor [Hartmannibacter diazotrophicus]